MKHEKFKQTTQIVRELNEQGESIEEMIRNALAQKQPLNCKSDNELLYTEKKTGIHPAYDIRTDRWDLALEATEKYQKSIIAKKNAEAPKEETKEDEPPKETA